MLNTLDDAPVAGADAPGPDPTTVAAVRAFYLAAAEIYKATYGHPPESGSEAWVEAIVTRLRGMPFCG